MNAKTKVINEANQIVTDHLIKRFVETVDFFYEIIEQGDQLILFSKDKSLCVIDISDNKDSISLVEKFCQLFADKSNILIDAKVDENKTIETLVFTMQDGEVFYMQDFSKLYIKL